MVESERRAPPPAAYPPDTSRTIWVTRKVTVKPMMTGAIEASHVHFALRVSFQIV